MNEVEKARKILDEVPNDKRFTWNFRQRAIAEHIIKSNGLDDFLSWPESADSLHSGYSAFSVDEERLLPKWMLAIGRDPDIGSPTSDLSPDGISGTFIRQLFIASIIENEIAPIGSIRRVLEFGGGYGAFAVILKRMGFDGDHYVYDLPAVHILREWYLEQQNINTVSLTKQRLLLVDVFVSVCAIDEVTPKDREVFLDSVVARHYIFLFSKEWDAINNEDWFSDWFARNGMTPTRIDIPYGNQAMLVGHIE